MSLISARIETNRRVLDKQIETARKLPTLMKNGANLEYRRFRAAWLPKLRVEPGKPQYPLRWASQKQRRYVMAKLRREGSLPYQRTHELVESWRMAHDTFENGGAVTIENTSPIARFVIGANQQPFHADTGWQRYEPIVKYARADWQKRQAAIWSTITHPQVTG